jgi:hypothetical protein
MSNSIMIGRILLAVLILPGFLVAQEEDREERFRKMSGQAETRGLAEPFRGIVANDEIEPGLFPIQASGVSTNAVREAAQTFLGALSEDQLSRTTYAVDDPEWRKWMNQHFYVRQGVGFDEMDEAQRGAAFAMMSASLSAKGLDLTRDIMRLNHTLGELSDNNFVEFGEWLYWITVMGEPSATEPWGWQLDGHHVIINYFVLGDQVVMSPVFVGSEPVTAEAGKFKGVEIMQDEQNIGLSMMQSLSGEQQAAATISVGKEGNDNLGEAFHDNIDLNYQGISAGQFSADQKDLLLSLINLYVGNMDDGHAKVKMAEVAARLDDTYFAWIGDSSDDAVYYYRIHSPVIMIEFDHQLPANLRHLYPREPNRQHIHAVVRTPNGNDYGKDLLRQHYERVAHVN